MPATSSASPLVRIDYPHLARREMLAFLPGDCPRVLDVGCNTGAFGELVKQTRPGVEVWGVEPDAGAAERATLHLDRVMQGFFDGALPLPRKATRTPSPIRRTPSPNRATCCACCAGATTCSATPA